MVSQRRVQLDLLIDDLWCASKGARTTFTPQELAREALYVVLAALPSGQRLSMSHAYLPEREPVDLDIHMLIIGEDFMVKGR